MTTLKIDTDKLKRHVQQKNENAEAKKNEDNADNNEDDNVTELTIEEQFQKMEHKEHALELPDTYIGSIELHGEPMWVIDERAGEEDNEENEEDEEDTESDQDDDPDADVDDKLNESKNTSRSTSRASSKTPSRTTSRSVSNTGTTRMVMRNIKYVPGLYKIYDEVLVNAIDHWTRMEIRINYQKEIKKGKAKPTPEVTSNMKFKPVKNIKVEIDQKSGSISVYNDGDGIPIAKHEEYGVYVPELLFSQFLTSGNYKGANVNQTKIIGGKNGYGAKLAALFSNWFTIETVDHNRQLKYIQTYRNNLDIIEPANIKPYKGLPYTKISFQPDFKRFGLEDLTDDMVAMFKKRVYDAAGWCSGVNVSLNDFKIPIRDFNHYTNLYLGVNKNRKRYFCTISDRWEIGVTYSDDQEFQQVSIVNGILTSKGGRHVNYIADQISRKLAKEISTEKNKISPKTVRSNMWLFLRCIVENPNFDSQTKEALTTQVSKFGSKCDIPLADIKKIGKVGISKRAKDFSAFKETQTSKATDGKKVTRVSDIEKLDDADYAGSKKFSHQCTLILTEGDSAKGFATAGLKALTAQQRKYYGIFPLRGKMLNVRDATQKQIDGNAEIAYVKRILALQSGEDYSGEGIKKLRYGKLMILTDSDHDGDHIKGLLINFIHKFWPSLIERNDFLTTMITPIVQVWKERKRGRKTEKYNIVKFFSQNEYVEWKRNNDTKGWKSRYYKGLATSTETDAQAFFREPKMIQYDDEPDKQNEIGVNFKPTDKAIELAFLKKNADLRKDWLLKADLTRIDEYNIERETISDFINHRLIHFSWADTYRSIPNICDGLKPSMRKIVYFCLKNKINNSLKVAQLGGKISEATCYHHGEASLEGTIVGLAQNFVSSNNINILKPEGNFGSRNASGKDAGQARYIYTKLEDMTPYIYKSQDKLLYKYLTDDGSPIEPEWYLPIIPMVLVNGANGIGTGFSTFIPQYNPIDIVGKLRQLIRGRSISNDDDIKPWYRGFTGMIKSSGKTGSYISIGNYKIYSNRVRIMELPIDGCFDAYKVFLEAFVCNISEDERKKRATTVKNKRYNPYNSPLWGSIKDVQIDSSYGQAEIIFKPGGLKRVLSGGVEKFEKELKLRSSIPVTNMVLFNEKLEIEKYPTANAIIERYFGVRMQYYELRRKLMIAENEFDLKRQSAKYRFVTEIINDELVIYKKPKAEIIRLLQERNYPKYQSRFDPRVVLGDLYKDDKTARVEVEKVESDDEDLDTDTDAVVTETIGTENYNYLLSMRIDSFTQEMLEQLKKEVDELTSKVDGYKNNTAGNLWSADLDEFEKEYMEWLKDWYEEKEIEFPASLQPNKTIRIRNVSRRAELPATTE
tara:strand:- start:5046 stop:9131 length:4086 start_codon:yes stop_codon:yes gene_type:complete